FERNESGSLSVGSQELLICKYVWIRCIAMVYFEGDSTILSSGDRQPRCFHRKRFGRYDGSRSPLPCQDQCPGNKADSEASEDFASFLLWFEDGIQTLQECAP